MKESPYAAVVKNLFATCLLLGLFVGGCSQKEEVSAPTPKATAAPASQAAPAAAIPNLEESPVTPRPAGESPSPAPVSPAPTRETSVAIKTPDVPSPATASDAPASTSPTARQKVLDKLDQLVTTTTEKRPPNTKETAQPASESGNSRALADFSSDYVTRGLIEALDKGFQKAVAQLGKDGGFLTNANVKIPMPEKLQQIDQGLRKLGQGKLADEFVTTMNRAAEQAVPVAAGVFADGLKHMTIEDAQGILKGPDDAATQYFRRVSGARLTEKFHPIVQDATAKAGLTAAYKQFMDKASFVSPFLGKESLDLDAYVTTKALDGLFKTVAEEEKRIRQNPVARTTDLLKSVFGSLKK